ncbi:hypothetical protein [Saccharicrinis sp. 156]|uniref:hypothetical protein n=1 Tax=Saccharicrinis sp. 156 TaxID=3417574 RepID=UPI003D34D9DC
MDQKEIREKVLNCRSKQDALLLSSFIVKNPVFIEELFVLMRNYKNKKYWLAAWVLDHVFEESPELLLPYMDPMIELFQTTKSGSIQRIVGKLLSFNDITDKVDGSFVNICFDMLTSQTIPVAVKVHAMQLVYNISTKFPELKPELKLVIQEQIPNNTVAFAARAKRLLKKL